uniref:Uncharacterized protein n=1 Tax=Nelumbo nucifera TaxID=4432 RepID=A0A822ZNB3_NELNU|nr:TPA_asm: hypothetical protein HUJ06_004493 [Nelumbo nucifera]
MELFLLSLLLLVPLIVSLSLYKHKSNPSGGKLPPGKMGLPFVGESIQFLSLGRKDTPEKFMYDRMAKFSTGLRYLERRPPSSAAPVETSSCSLTRTSL